jgi:hypothetical protein
MTAIVAFLSSAEAVGLYADLMTPKQAGIVAATLALLAVLLGVNTHNRVTALADPKTSDGTPLVPVGSPGSALR